MPQLTVCPSCAEPCDPDDKFCGACGAGLTAVVPPDSAATPHPDEGQGTVPCPGNGKTPAQAVPPCSSAPPDWALAAPVPPQAHTPAEGPPTGERSGVPEQPPQQPAAGPEAGRTGQPAPPSWTLTTQAATAPAAPTGYTTGNAPWASPTRPAPGTPQGQPAPDRPAPQEHAAPASPDPRKSVSATSVAPGGPWAGKVCIACATGGIDGDGYCEFCGHAQPRERDHVERELDEVAGVSDRGLRHHRNEDALQVSATSLPGGSPAVVAVVCDGVSSATRPDDASAAAADAATEALLSALESGTQPEKAMHDALLTAAQAVNALAEGPSLHHNAPACTCVSAVAADGAVTVGWVGDSRAYWVPDDRSTPQRLTEDDSWAARMVATGLMSEAEAYADERAHAITGWLGADAVDVTPHTAGFRPDRPGAVVVCTDGLWNYAESAESMAAAVPRDARSRPLRSAQHLVGFALDEGGHDNVTVAVLPFPPGSGRAPDPQGASAQAEAPTLVQATAQPAPQAARPSAGRAPGQPPAPPAVPPPS